MEGIKLIDASEVVTSKKTSKVEIKKISKGPMKIITDDSKKNIVESVSRIDAIARPDDVKHDIVSTTDIVAKSNIGNRTIIAIRLKQDIYYGPKNTNKNKFMRMYKKLGLKWITDISINGMMVDGWFNNDKSQYIIKLLEDGDFKRFTFCGCDEIYDYFVSLGGTAFDHGKENLLSANYKNNEINNTNKIKESSMGIVGQKEMIHNANNVDSANIANNIKDTGEKYIFVGADLWSGYRTGQLLKKVPDNWGVKWI